MDLAAYFARIGFHGAARPDLATLIALHRAHVHEVPFENFDVQLGRRIGLDVQAAFEKIVQQRRGGWCYEMNGVFGWVLEQIGFDVMRVSAGVMRAHAGDAQLGNHLCLLVQLDRPYLVDVGFGGSLLEPLALQAMQREDTPFHITLHQTDDHYWRFCERLRGTPFSFDFQNSRADEALFAQTCLRLQSDPASPFVQNLVVQRRSADTHMSLRGRVLTISDATHDHKIVLDCVDRWVATVRDTFHLEIPDAASLWPAICARHAALFA